MREEVGKFIKDKNIDYRDAWPATWRMILVAIVAAVTWYLSVSDTYNVYLRCVIGVMFGICQTLPLLHVMHDASHNSLGHDEIWWKIAGRLSLEWFSGASMLSWQHQVRAEFARLWR